MENVNQSVKEKYNTISESLLAEMADGSPYWENVESFWNRVKDRELGTLSFKEKNWLIKIESDLLDESL